ncbi:hypothetical protein IB642_00160 [Allofrancisella guangzhouensis]|uniref:Alpha/beta hydrolase n=1 Tax=Allofrancisella guangzhouensis TaxID=594679 RepID=A0A0A8E3D1_9GAMM|nr:hypothetical protein [Allofrancisella guangzhouensis]AJC48735.1 hypothetical protein SD28_03300 [Allofrancisella guangzhouensis]MBK2027385.1 hypothetical protein [Allofrancisella guangzhouensis]MBK2043430.1 hypothetical protein [Allofrancisella guangzhouensis]MBK2045199.1 hypothetical protein [Allofrancisella guangzhouensis]
MKKVAVLGPILARWKDHVYLMKPFDELPNQELKFKAIDPLTFCYGCDSLGQAKNNFLDWLKLNKNEYDIFMGFALGGTLIQTVFDDGILDDKKVVLFSSPSIADEGLKSKLGEILEYLYKADLTKALIAKEKIVANLDDYDIEYELSEVEEKEAIERMQLGLNLILQANLSILEKVPKNTKVYIGEKSQLATPNNVKLPANKMVIVPNASMRLFQDNLDFMLNELEKTIKEWRCE